MEKAKKTDDAVMPSKKMEDSYKVKVDSRTYLPIPLYSYKYMFL